MRVHVERTVLGPQLEECWSLYNVAFEELRSMAAQRHVMVREEFVENMRDHRIIKFMAIDDSGAIRGLSTYTNDLSSMHLISPDYFEQRWPQQFADHDIWYVGFVGIHPEERHAGLYDLLITEMTARHRGKPAVVGMDVCGRNAKIGFPQGTLKIVSRQYDNVTLERRDEQSYWTFDFSAASPRPDGWPGSTATA
jgi:hypothetical protein